MPRYFGFYGNANDAWGDSVHLTLGYTNLHWVDAGQTEKIIRARNMGAKVIINAVQLVFNYPATTPSDQRATLQAWWMGLSPELQDTVVAFLVADEPFRANDNNYHLPTEQLNSNLNSAAQWLKSFTGKAMCISASGPEYDKFGVPRGFDWIGMYRYSYNTYWPQLMYSVMNLKRKLASGQKMMAVMDAYADSTHPIDESRIKSFNSWWQTFIGWYEKDFIAVCPFLYQTTKMGEVQVWGASSMPRVLLDLQSYALKITATPQV
jgi:hypothetical protein